MEEAFFEPVIRASFSPSETSVSESGVSVATFSISELNSAHPLVKSKDSERISNCLFINVLDFRSVDLKISENFQNATGKISNFAYASEDTFPGQF